MRMRYLGVSDPEKVFGQWRALRRDWCDLRLKCAPFSEEWKALDAMIKSLDAGAGCFTGQEDFYGGVSVITGKWAKPTA